MTNEELAVQIQIGHTERYAELWQNVRRLMYKILYSKIQRVELPAYITVEDLKQELYFTLCNAVQAYDDTKPYKFTTYLERHIMNAVRSALPSKPLNEYSYNQTTGEDEDTELVEFIADDTSAESFEAVELTDIQTLVRQAVAELPSKEKQAVTLHYFKGIRYNQIAQIMGTDENTAKKTTRKGLNILRQNKALQGIYGELQRHYTRTELVYRQFAEGWLYSDEYAAVKLNIKQKRLSGEYISYGTEQCILYRAEQKYIRQRADNVNAFYVCR